MLTSNTKLLFCLIILLFSALLQRNELYCATDSAITTKTLPLDSSKVMVRRLNAEEQKKLLENSDYKYDRVGPAPKTLWERIKEWFWRMIDKLFDSKSGNVTIRILEVVLIIAAIVLIVFLLLKNEVRSLFYGKSASVPIDFKEFEEDIHKINFDELINEAIAKRDYRKAIRLHFLKLLKELTDKNLIKWQIDKTNNDYSMELSNSKYNSQFKQLSLMYEYIWYGDFPLDESNFKSTITTFQEFKV